MFIIRFCFYFTLSFALLCIPVGENEHLFDKLYNIASPYVHKAMKTTNQKISSTKKYSKKLYSNSEPFEKDEVKAKYAGVQKQVIKKNAHPDDTYTEDEQARLKKILDEK
jgi:hypothetical protein